MSAETDALGEALRAARADRGLSSRALARLAGISQSFLSNVENGRTTPSVPTLYALAEALGLGAADLLPESSGDAEAIPAGHVTPLPDSDSGESPPVALRLLAAARGRSIETYLIEQRAGFVDTKAYGHPGEDLIYVIAGKVSLVRRDERVTLREGDVAWLDATTEHSFTTPADSGVTALLVSIR